MKDTNVPVEKCCKEDNIPKPECKNHHEARPLENWEERIELARRRCSEIIDLDQEPPVKYISMRCKAALEEIEEIDELHKKVLSQAIQAARIEAKEEERKRIADSIGSFPLRDYMFFDESNWEAGYKALWEFKQSIINNHQ